MGNRKKKQSKIDKKKWSKRIAIVALILIAALTLYSFKDMIFCTYPAIVMEYKMRYNQMATSEYLQEFRTYAGITLNDSFDELNWTQLLDWEHNHLSYWSAELQVRPEMPIDILSTNQFGYVYLTKEITRYAVYCTQTKAYIVYLAEGETTDDIIPGSFQWLGYTVGRCGEFALLYNGLLLANGYRSRIVVDCSIKTDGRSAGDHVWNEVWMNNGTWIHVDPTERIINSPEMYSNPDRWDKNVNLVYAIEGNAIEDVTNRYAGD